MKTRLQRARNGGKKERNDGGKTEKRRRNDGYKTSRIKQSLERCLKRRIKRLNKSKRI